MKVDQQRDVWIVIPTVHVGGAGDTLILMHLLPVVGTMCGVTFPGMGSRRKVIYTPLPPVPTIFLSFLPLGFSTYLSEFSYIFFLYFLDKDFYFIFRYH